MQESKRGKGKEESYVYLRVDTFVLRVCMPIFPRMARRKLPSRWNMCVQGRHMGHVARKRSAVHSCALTHRHAHRIPL